MDHAAELADQGNAQLAAHMAAAAHRFEASEDVYGGNGMKLLAKGARINPSMREQLLNHKLLKPLEQCVRVVDGVIPERFGPIAEQLLADHPLLATLCATDGGQRLADTLTGLRLSEPIQSLLTLHGELVGERIQHSVGVAMLAVSFARRLAPGDTQLRLDMGMAGLVHDVGELYIDPLCLQRDRRLDAEQWRQIAAHPTIGHRVLKRLPGAGDIVAEAVLLHHERHNGYGYPRRVSGAEIALHGQILATAEWLMGIIGTDLAPLVHTQVAARLLPGEFAEPLLNLINAAATGNQELEALLASLTPLMDLVPRVERMAGTLRRFAHHRAWIDTQISSAKGTLRQILESGLDRMQRIQTAFSSTGLDSDLPEVLLREFASVGDHRVQLEVIIVMRELERRLQDLERESLMRAALLPAPQAACIKELLARMKQRDAA